MTTRSDILSKLDIRPADWVLEIGGGPTPFERSDIIADKFIDQNKERAANIVIDRPFIVCDAHYLPFTDNAFDYVFCSQILEHLEDPELFFKEISRVAKRGYIETPNEIRERLFGWSFHKWIVNVDEGGIVLRANDVEQEFGLFFHKLQWENYEFNQFCTNAHDLLNVCYEWDGLPSYRVDEKMRQNATTEKKWVRVDEISSQNIEYNNKKITNKSEILKTIKNKIPSRLKQKIKRYVSPPIFGFKHNDAEALAHLKASLACPICKGKVTYEKESICCDACKRNYIYKENVPVMLGE